MLHFRENVKTKTQKILPRTTKLVRKYRHKGSESNNLDEQDEVDAEEKFEEVAKSEPFFNSNIAF